MATTDPIQTATRSDITLRTSILPELARLIDQLSIDLGKTPIETIVQSLVMLQILMRAGHEGKRIAITDEDLNVEREILIPGYPHDDA